jgi:hypothetical protein
MSCGCGRRVPVLTIVKALAKRRGIVCSSCLARCDRRSLVRWLGARI